MSGLFGTSKEEWETTKRMRVWVTLDRIMAGVVFGQRDSEGILCIQTEKVSGKKRAVFKNAEREYPIDIDYAETFFESGGSK